MDLPDPQIWDVKPPPSLQGALETRFAPLQSTHPGMVRFARSNKASPFLRFDHRWHLDSFEGGAAGVPQKSGPVRATIAAYKDGKPDENEGQRTIDSFCKITHLLDAFRMIQGHYPMAQHPALPAPGRRSAKVFAKLHDAHNQAYVDAVACYMLSKLRESNYSPHFSLFYGAYLAIAKEYYYNITEDFPDIRFEKWFWENQKAGLFRFLGYDGEELMDEKDSLFEQPEDLDSETESGSEVSELHDADGVKAEVESLKSASITTASSAGEEMGRNSNSGDSAASSDYDGDEDYDNFGESVKLFAAIKDFPTMLMFLESNTDTMDSLLDAGAADPEREEKWTAWLFQVIAALCQIQSLWAMTHNDLHSNNILWVPTDQTHFYYKTNDGRSWKVPTYGKLFRIIDFGRAIYTHNDTLCISDDYMGDNEAGGQYNFGPFYDPDLPRVYPNPSFDLCRLSVSILEGLFPEVPTAREGGAVLSQEPGRKQMETTSDLWNTLWSWLIDDDGRNVLWEEDEQERYPGFDLYKVIAQKVHGAVPREQLDRAPFCDFALPEGVAPPTGAQVFPLFC
jgi:hypothetical protein